MSRAWEYIMSVGGIASEAAYNFTGTGGPHSPPPAVPPTTSFEGGRCEWVAVFSSVLSLMRPAGTCKHEPEVATVSSAVNISYGDLAGLTAAVATQGPVSVVSHHKANALLCCLGCHDLVTRMRSCLKQRVG